MNEIDDYFLPLQVIHAMLQAQFDFVNKNYERVDKVLNEICPIAREQGCVEPLLIRGWTSLANKEYNHAKRWANQAKEIAPENLEVGVLLAWIILEETPKKAKEASSILRDYGIRANPDDWYYQEALAYASAFKSDWKQAQNIVRYAIETAPSHVQRDLVSASDDFENNKLSRIDWKERLQSTWRLSK
jgi:tetratricopeptide (TPR) repeat protein